MFYTPKNHYWTVEGKPGVVWSSARKSYVPDTDAEFVAWQAASGLGVTWSASEAALRESLDVSDAIDWAPPEAAP